MHTKFYVENETNFCETSDLSDYLHVSRNYVRFPTGIYVRRFGNFDINDIFISLPESNSGKSMVFQKDMEEHLEKYLKTFLFLSELSKTSEKLYVKFEYIKPSVYMLGEI